VNREARHDQVYVNSSEVWAFHYKTLYQERSILSPNHLAKIETATSPPTLRIEQPHKTASFQIEKSPSQPSQLYTFAPPRKCASIRQTSMLANMNKSWKQFYVNHIANFSPWSTLSTQNLLIVAAQNSNANC
jgi:hypothetical protein